MASKEVEARLGRGEKGQVAKARKPKTRRGKRELEKRAPKEHEEVKHLLTINGGKTTQVRA